MSSRSPVLAVALSLLLAFPALLPGGAAQASTEAAASAVERPWDQRMASDWIKYMLLAAGKTYGVASDGTFRLVVDLVGGVPQNVLIVSEPALHGGPPTISVMASVATLSSPLSAKWAYYVEQANELSQPGALVLHEFDGNTEVAYVVMVRPGPDADLLQAVNDVYNHTLMHRLIIEDPAP